MEKFRILELGRRKKRPRRVSEPDLAAVVEAMQKDFLQDPDTYRAVGEGMVVCLILTHISVQDIELPSLDSIIRMKGSQVYEDAGYILFGDTKVQTTAPLMSLIAALKDGKRKSRVFGKLNELVLIIMLQYYSRQTGTFQPDGCRPEDFGIY